MLPAIVFLSAFVFALGHSLYRALLLAHISQRTRPLEDRDDRIEAARLCATGVDVGSKDERDTAPFSAAVTATTSPSSPTSAASSVPAVVASVATEAIEARDRLLDILWPPPSSPSSSSSSSVPAFSLNDDNASTHSHPPSAASASASAAAVSVRRFLIQCAINNTVDASVDEATGRVTYQSSSPDELALCEFAAFCGFELCGREPTCVRVRAPARAHCDDEVRIYTPTQRHPRHRSK